MRLYIAIGLFSVCVIFLAGVAAHRLRDCRVPAEPVLIEMAAHRYVKERQAKYVSVHSSGQGWVDVEFEHFASAEDLLRENPDCCRVSYRMGEGYLPPLLWRLWVGYSGVVSIGVSREPVEEIDGVFPIRSGMEYLVTRCGELIEFKM